MVDFKELIQKMKAGEVPSSSEFNLMNEKRQTLPKGAGIKRFSYEFQKKSKVMFFMQMAIPFNPETGKVDDDFNPNKKWRPPISVTTAASIVKQYCLDNAEARVIFEKRAGVTEWDVSDPATLNAKDFKVLREYRTPLILTTEATTINDATITGQDYGIRYSVDIKRDLDTGQVIGEIPPIMKIGNLMSSITFNEVNELGEAINAKDPSLYKNERPFINKTAIPACTEQDAKEWRSKIFQSGIISSVRPINMLLALEYPLSQTSTMRNSDTNLPLVDYTSLEVDDVKSHLVYFDLAKKYQEYVESVASTGAGDYFWDFIECDISDSTTTEPKDVTAKMAASRSLKPAKSPHSFYNEDDQVMRFDWVNDFLTAVAGYRDSDPEFEKKMMQFLATKVRAFDSSLVGSVCDRIKQLYPINYIYLTSDLLKMHKEILLDIYDDEYQERAMEEGLFGIDSVDTTEEKPQELEASAMDLINEAFDETEEEEDEGELDTSETPLSGEDVEVQKVVI